MKKVRIISLVCVLVLILSGCAPKTTMKAKPLPKPGTVIVEESDGIRAIKVITEEEAKQMVFNTLTPQEKYGILPWHEGFWVVALGYTICMADISLLETVDCAFGGYAATIAQCRVNAVHNARPESTLQAGDVVNIVLNASTQIPFNTVQPLKKNGRYLVALDELETSTDSGWDAFQGYAQYRAVEDQWCQLEVTGKHGENPAVDTVNMGYIYALDKIPGCEDYLTWGTRDVARFFAETEIAEEKRLGEDIVYRTPEWMLSQHR